MEMLKEELKNLYKAKPELIEEHKRLVDVLRTGSKKEQIKEAERQLKELKEMVGKADRCWEGYEPTPGKKPYEKGSCQPVKKEEAGALDKEEKSKRTWKIKIKGKPGYHDVKDVLDMGSQQHNSYVLHDGTTVHHDDVEDLDITDKYPSVAHKTDLEDKITAIKAKYSAPKEKSFNEKVKEIKQKYAEKPEPSEDMKIGAMKMKYTSMFKSDYSEQDLQRLAQEVRQRQPTDAELELLLDYNSKIQQNIAEAAMINEKDEDPGY